MLPMVFPLSMLKKKQFVIHYKSYLMIYGMECPKLCSTILIPKWNTFKIIPSNVDYLNIYNNGWFNIRILRWTPAIIRIKISHETHSSELFAHMFTGGYHYTTECSELIVLAGDIKVK
jgi:hypothetical protein